MVEVIVNSLEQKSSGFCPNYAQEYPLCSLSAQNPQCPNLKIAGIWAEGTAS